MVFQAPFDLNNEYEVNFKGGCPPVDGGSNGAQPSLPTQFVVLVTPPTCSGGQLRLFPCCKTRNRGCTRCQHAVRSFCLPQFSQKRESTTFEIVLRNAWGLSSPSKQGNRSSIPFQKRSQVWGRGGQNICNRDASVGNGKKFEKQAQSSKG